MWVINVYTDTLDATGRIIKTAVEKQQEVATMLRTLGTSQQFADRTAADFAIRGNLGDHLHASLQVELVIRPPHPSSYGIVPSQAAMDVAADVRLATAHDFLMHDTTKPGVSIYGIVAADGTLDFAVYAQVMDPGTQVPGRGMLSGTYMFERMMNHFASQGTSILAIRGNWNTESNLNLFNILNRIGLTPMQAALGTYTGRWAIGRGFTEVNHIETTPPNTFDGTARSATVIFRRP